jgi:hypothetical protein
VQDGVTALRQIERVLEADRPERFDLAPVRDEERRGSTAQGLQPLVWGPLVIGVEDRQGDAGRLGDLDREILAPADQSIGPHAFERAPHRGKGQLFSEEMPASRRVDPRDVTADPAEGRDEVSGGAGLLLRLAEERDLSEIAGHQAPVASRFSRLQGRHSVLRRFAVASHR